MTREEALVVVTMLVEAYPRDVQPQTLKAYVTHLLDLDKATTLEAVKRLIRTAKWLPTVAEIRKAEAAVRMPYLPTVDEAWARAVAMLSNGKPAPVTAGDVLVTRVLALLGRHEDVSCEPLRYLRPRFFAAYQRLSDDFETSVAAGELPGWVDGTLLSGPARDPQVLLDSGGGR